jgi:lipopolysaccharide export system protein LptA
MTARKLFIILVTVAGVLLLYVIYGYFGSAKVPVPQSGLAGASDTNAQDSGGNVGKIGTTSVGTVVKSAYLDYDENRNVKREFGFERLLHESGNEWTIEKPYMNIIEKDFICGITADTGKVQVEMAAGKPTPKDAQLSGNVIIHILPDKGARMSESFIYLDDIRFISEKSLFTTDGPVRFVSADAEMAGTGLEVIYNTGQDRLELMHLMKLEYLRLKTFKESIFAKNGGSAENAPKGNSAAAVSHQNKKDEEPYYRCTLNKNVVINYGSQAVLADEVTISNLFFPKNKDFNGKKDTEKTANSAPAAAVNNAAEPIIPIVITCDEGIIVRPMETASSTAKEDNSPQRLLEFTGTPVMIKTSDTTDADNTAASVSGSRILAECGWLKYNLDLGILDMFSGKPPQNVSLNLEQNGSRLETTDSLRWSLKDRTAVIRGPGTLYLAEQQTSGKKSDANNARMNFGGTMNVYFADTPPQKSLRQAVSLKSIYLAGGFTAAVQNDRSHLAADSATFDFAGDNAISQANLDGNVKFDSDSGSLRSQTAKVFFAKGNAVSQADFDGGVIVASDTGSLRSEKAKVFFAKDSKGQMYAATVESSGNVEIIPAKAKDAAPQGVFRAQRIDYDVPTGHAVANGPVELVYNDANGSPATITAKRRAEYFQKSNEVVFEGDVAGKMMKSDGRINEYTEFHGDKLTAKLGQAQQNKTKSDSGSRLEHLSITGDIVKFESYQKQQDALLGGVKLKCRQVDYDGAKNAVWASGGSDCFVVIDNSKAPESSNGGSFNLKGPCYARLWDFETLQWSMTDNRIIADGIPSGMHLAYLPIAGGKYDRKVQIDAGHVQVDLTQTPVGRKEVSALKATGGIHYLEENSYEFYGSQLLYDSGKAMISIAGDSAKPCLLNGVIVDSIAYNLSNGSVQTQGLRGGAIPPPPKKAK